MFPRKTMTLVLPVLVLTLAGFLPGAATAGNPRHPPPPPPPHPTPQQCCCSLITVNIEFEPTIVLVNNEPVLSYNVVNVASFWNNVDILTFEDILSHNTIASNNSIELTKVFQHFEVISLDQSVVGVDNEVVYVLKH